MTEQNCLYLPTYFALKLKVFRRYCNVYTCQFQKINLTFFSDLPHAMSTNNSKMHIFPESMSNPYQSSIEIYCNINVFSFDIIC